MTARRCFSGKVASGQVDAAAGARVLEMLERFEGIYKNRFGDRIGAQKAAEEVQAIAAFHAAEKANATRENLLAQIQVLRTFRGYEERVQALRGKKGDFGFGNKAPPTLGKPTQSTLGYAVRSMLARDPFEIATWQNVHALAQDLRGRAHAAFAQAIEDLRPRGLGFLPQYERELDFLRAAYGRSDVDAQARAAADAWFRVNDPLANEYMEAGGKLTKRERYFPNFHFDENKVRAAGLDALMEDARANVDRTKMIDFATGEPLSDARFEELLTEAARSIAAGGVEGEPTSAFRGRRALANRRDYARFFIWKDAEAWQAMAEKYGAHASPFQAAIDHIDGITRDIALMRVFGRNPEATKRFIMDLFSREPERLFVTAGDKITPKRALFTNRAIEARVRSERRLFEDLWSEVTGENAIPVNLTMARAVGDVRGYLSAAQLGSALISSFTDVGTVAITSRFNGLPLMNVIARATSMMAEKGSEVFAAQQGLIMDTLAHAARATDRYNGETVRTGVAAKLAAANIRVSGLRRWTAIWRSAFALEMMAHVAHERGKAFAELEETFRNTLARYGIDEAQWNLIRGTTPHEPRPQALFIRPMDILEGGTPAHRLAAENLARMRDTEMDYAVIDRDPVTRALALGQSQPGTLGGEARRSLFMYRAFPAAFLTMHFARAMARGWDGSRLGHGAMTFISMLGFGALAMQAKEILAGRDPLSLDPTTADGLRAWGKATIQGGGLGVFGDMLFIDQTRYGNTWASTLAGPVAGAVETVVGDFLIKNVQKTAKGEQTTFAGDALYAAGRHMPFSSLWYSRLAFQRAALDQLALIADPRARQRFRRIERQAREERNQRYWARPGRSPNRLPDLEAIAGGR